MLIRWIDAVPGRRPLRLVSRVVAPWVEWRPKLGVWDVVENQSFGQHVYPKLLLRTDDLFAAIGRMLKGPRC